jgi:prepilin-type N-terminal cleavage/methylation domain-containing protein
VIYPCKQRGFTLVELLVSISVIAVIAGITYPLITSAKGRGYEASNISNLRQLGAAWLLYSSDNGERYPLIKTLYYEKLVPEKILISQCDRHQNGWANLSIRFFPTKVSVLDKLVIRGENVDDDYVELHRTEGWAVLPGCNAILFGSSNYITDSYFKGSFSRLNRDGSVVSKSIPLHQNWVDTYLFFGKLNQ